MRAPAGATRSLLHHHQAPAHHKRPCADDPSIDGVYASDLDTLRCVLDDDNSLSAKVGAEPHSRTAAKLFPARAAANPQAPCSREAQAAVLFKLCDLNGDGVLDAGELATALQVSRVQALIHPHTPPNSPALQLYPAHAHSPS